MFLIPLSDIVRHSRPRWSGKIKLHTHTNTQIFLFITFVICNLAVSIHCSCEMKDNQLIPPWNLVTSQPNAIARIIAWLVLELALLITKIKKERKKSNCGFQSWQEWWDYDSQRRIMENTINQMTQLHHSASWVCFYFQSLLLYCAFTGCYY